MEDYEPQEKGPKGCGYKYTMEGNCLRCVGAITTQILGRKQKYSIGKARQQEYF